MRHSFFAVIALSLALALHVSTARAQDADPEPVIISIYQVAPGQHVAFLQWMAQQEALSTEAGVPATQWYAHIDGASWDYVTIGPATTDEQDAQVEALAEQKGMLAGPPAGIEFRKYINTHTDTYAAGPMTIADLLAAAQGR